jgi:predicted RNase H-like HicB family nuclease
MARTKKPDRYIFPAIFTYEEDGGISVSFPDLPGCLTCGDNQEEALLMAQDALRGHLATLEDLQREIPKASDIRKIEKDSGEEIVIVEAWMLPLRHKTVRKNLTIPAYLATAADQAGINFSQVLSEALRSELGMQ